MVKAGPRNLTDSTADLAGPTHRHQPGSARMSFQCVSLFWCLAASVPDVSCHPPPLHSFQIICRSEAPTQELVPWVGMLVAFCMYTGSEPCGPAQAVAHPEMDADLLISGCKASSLQMGDIVSLQDKLCYRESHPSRFLVLQGLTKTIY